MSETTSSKKRLAITITSMCVAVVAVICSIVAIFAATRQTVTTQFKVTYSATNVAATVSADYKLKGSTTDPVSLGSVEILATADITTYDTLSTDEEIELTTTNNYVIFRYSFTNNSTSKAFTATLTDGASKNNVTLTYASNTTGEYPVVGSSNSAWSSDVPTDVPVAASTSETVTTVYIYIKAEITNLANDANYESKEGSLVSWTLNAA